MRTAHDWVHARALPSRIIRVTLASATVATIAACDNSPTAPSTSAAPTPPSADAAVTAAGTAYGLGAGYPHQPSGFTTFTDRAFNATTENGWTTPGSRASILWDGSAPASPSKVMKITYPAGLAGGDTPVAFEHAFRNGTEFYGAIWVKFSSNFIGNGSGVNKILYVWANDGKPAVYLSAQAYGWGNFQPQVRTQDATYTDLTPNMGGQTGYVFRRNTWVKWEFYLKMNTPGQSNGVVKCWMNGVQVSQYTNQRFSNSSHQTYWNKMQVAPYWGGMGGRIGSPQYMYLDHLHGSVR
jgi:polysaccharide lyase-like protein